MVPAVAISGSAFLLPDYRLRARVKAAAKFAFATTTMLFYTKVLLI